MTTLSKYLGPCTLVGLAAAFMMAAQATDDPPADVAATVAADAKAVGTTVKRDAKVCVLLDYAALKTDNDATSAPPPADKPRQ